jgi:hypothetical protein
MQVQFVEQKEIGHESKITEIAFRPPLKGAPASVGLDSAAVL